MENLNLDKFSPKKADITLLAEKYKNLEIKGVEDIEGYKQVDVARKELKNTRVEIQKTGKMLRADALSFQKNVIALEKELVSIIEPLEIELQGKQKAIDLEKEMNKRKELIPQRQEKLKELSVVINDEFLLVMDDSQFQEFYNLKKTEMLEKKEQEMLKEKVRLLAEQEEKEKKLKEAEDKIKAEKKKLEDDKRLEEAKKQARIEADKKAKIDAENAKIQAKIDLENVKKQAEKEKRDAIEAERKRVEDEKQARIEADRLKEQEEKAEQEKIERKKKYQNFLAKNNYRDDGSFYKKIDGNKIELFKKIDEIII